MDYLSFHLDFSLASRKFKDNYFIVIILGELKPLRLFHVLVSLFTRFTIECYSNEVINVVERGKTRFLNSMIDLARGWNEVLAVLNFIPYLVP